MGVGSSTAESAGKTQAGSVLPVAVLHSLALQETCADMVLLRDLQELAIAMENLADQIERLRQPIRTRGQRHSDAPGHLGKAELLVEASGKRRVGEIVGEEAVVLRGQRTDLVAQPVGQYAGFVEQHQTRTV